MTTQSTIATVLPGLIPLAVPLIIAVVKALLPKLPSATWPVVAPLLGAVADIIIHYAGLPTMGTAWGAMLGAAGVGVREIHDQLVQLINSTNTPPPSQ